MKKMRKYLMCIAVAIMVLLESFCNSIYENSYHNLKAKNPPTTTLDSLQGSWVSIDDSLNKVIISGRLYTEFYADSDSTREYFRIYFSDTLVDINLAFNNIQIDTTQVSGKYIITKSISDNSFWCYTLNGFRYIDNGVSFSISDTWAHHKPTVFRN